jgi:hypothetical protein
VQDQVSKGAGIVGRGLAPANVFGFWAAAKHNRKHTRNMPPPHYIETIDCIGKPNLPTLIDWHIRIISIYPWLELAGPQREFNI